MYVITRYYYIASEPDDSEFNVFGPYSKDDADKELKLLTEKQLKYFEKTELNDRENVKNEAKDNEIIETETSISYFDKGIEVIYQKSLFKIKQGLRGYIVGDFGDGKENYFHYGGCDGFGDFCIFNVQLIIK